MVQVEQIRTDEGVGQRRHVAGETGERSGQDERGQLQASYVVAHGAHAVLIDPDARQRVAEHGSHQPPQAEIHTAEHREVQEKEDFRARGFRDGQQQIRAGDEHAVDHRDRPARGELLQLGDDAPVELTSGKTEHQDFDWSERHHPPPSGVVRHTVEVFPTGCRRVVPTITGRRGTGSVGGGRGTHVPRRGTTSATTARLPVPGPGCCRRRTVPVRCARRGGRSARTCSEPPDLTGA